MGLFLFARVVLSRPLVMRLLPVLAFFLCCLPGWPSHGAVPAVPAELQPLAREGKEQFEKGEYARAERTYRKILAQAPNNLYAQSNLGVVLFRANRLPQAEEAFKKAIAIAPKDGFSHCTLGIIYYGEEKYDEAINELTKALAIDPKNATAHNYLGLAAAQKGWIEAAQKELELGLKTDPHYAEAAFNLAALKARQSPRDREAVRQYYQRALELGAGRNSEIEDMIAGRDLPPDLQRRASQARGRFADGEYEAAEKTCREIETAMPDHVGALSMLGVVLLRERKYALAEEALKKALTVSSGDDVAHCTLGLVYYGERKYDEAVAELTKATQASPPSVVAGAYLRILLEQKEWRESTREEIEAALQFAPVYNEGAPGSSRLDDRSVPQGRVDWNPLAVRVADAPASSPGIPPAMQAQANEARQAFEKGDYRQAEGIYREILKTAPDNLSVLSNLGVVLFRQKKLKEAEDCFAKAIAIEPVDGFAHCTLGIVYYTQGKYDAAISELNKAIAVDGKNATAHNYLGVTWSQKGHQEQAQREFETAIALDPNYADADYNLAVLLATKSSPDMEKARQYYRQARKLGAEADPALERLMGQKGAKNAPAGSRQPMVRLNRSRSGFGDFYPPDEMDWMRRYSLVP